MFLAGILRVSGREVAEKRGEWMIFARTTTLIILAGVLAVAPAAWARTHDEVQAPRGQDIQALGNHNGHEFPTPRR